MTRRSLPPFVSSVALTALLTVGASAPAAMPSAAHAPTALSLHCQMAARAVDVQRVELRFDLRNDGPQAVRLLRWGSPFEGAWFAPFVTVHGPQGELPYQGAQVKRGDPTRDDYLRLAPGQTVTATLNLREAFDWSAAPSTELVIQANWRWHDAVTAGRGDAPRPRGQHQGLDQACGTARVRL